MLTSRSFMPDDAKRVSYIAKTMSPPRESRLKLTKAKNNLLEYEDPAKSVHTSHFLCARDQMEEMRGVHSRSNEAILAFDAEHNRIVSEGTYSSNDMAAKYRLALPMAEALTLDKYAPPNCHELQAILGELLNQQVSSARYQQITNDLPRLAAVGDNSDAARLCTPIYEMYWDDILAYEDVWNRLHTTDIQAKALQQRVEELYLQREKSLRSDDMIASEQCHDQELSSLEEFMGLMKDRVKICEARGIKEEEVSRLRAFQEDASNVLKRSIEQQMSLLSRFDSDLKTIDSANTAAAARNAKEEQDFQQWIKSNSDAIVDNEKLQITNWNAILSLYSELQDLGNRRYSLVSQRIVETEREDARKAEYIRMLKVHDEHQKLLGKLGRVSSENIDALNGISNYVANACQKTIDKIDEIDKDLEELYVTELKNYLAVFRRFYLSCGELKYKKEIRHMALERTIRKQEELIEVATETLDPNTKRYRQDQANLRITQEEVARKIAQLGASMERATMEFTPIEEELVRVNVVFLHPTLEYQDVNLNRRANIVDVVKKYNNTDNEGIAEEEMDIRRTAEATEKAKRIGPTQKLLPQTLNYSPRYNY